MIDKFSKRQKSELLGRLAEYFAIIFMFFKGYRLLQYRYKCPYGEIDLIFKHGNIVVFCEVKYRSDAEQLFFSLGDRQKQRIKKAANFWMGQKKIVDYNARFDFIGLTFANKPAHIIAAF